MGTALKQCLSLRYQTYASGFKADSLSHGHAAIHFQNALEISAVQSFCTKHLILLPSSLHSNCQILFPVQ